MRTSRVQQLGVAVAVMSTALFGAHVADAGGAAHQASGVYQFDDGSHVGHAALHRNGNGVTMNLWTTVGGELDDFGVLQGVDWERGDATTVWFIVFNDPDGCIDGCGEDEVLDFFFGGDRAMVGALRAAGHVAGGSNFNASGRLNEGDDTELLFGTPLIDAMTAEIHLVVRSHGPASNLSGAVLAEALHSVDGGCDINTCGDSQFAVFTPPAG